MRPRSAVLSGYALILPAILLILLTASGCPFAPKPAPDQEELQTYLPQSSPLNCLLNLGRAYNDRNLDEYLKLFSEDFTFEFNPADVMKPDPTPASWGIAEERHSTETMFADELVRGIHLTFLPGASSASNEYPGYWRVVMDDIHLEIATYKPDGTPLTWLVQQAQDVFFFREYEQEKASDGNPVWRIWRWKDQPPAGATASASGT